MKTLVSALFFSIIGWMVTDTRILAQVPPDIKTEMKSEQPEQRGPAVELKGDLVAVILYYSKAKLWVVTKIHLFAPHQGIFKDDDIETISREVDGKMVELYRKKRERKKQEKNEERT